ncbi:Rv1678 family membrane protein [Gordonia rhizosphera]|uniref:TQO small subunit DoxD domain-containing protein n=1 Tax=Gordonia rhizosphera NBRC 16068 TaxID=1108045 RepID=K6VQP4_9ACTN|nr:hypothetical protein [Gordonia rhizosphera]GAB89230.1 hypothetical protein GORHZ_055_00130 [Gordonia rhizosphera NBRC 16068]
MAATGPGRIAGWLLAPTPLPEKGGQISLAVLRIIAGLIWLHNVAWKIPPDFGENRDGGLYLFTNLAVDHPVFAPYSWAVEHVVLPNFTAFGWLVLALESTLAVLLLTGTLVRFAALLGIGQSLAIGLSVAEAPHEWPWAYIMLIAIHVVLLFTACARFAAVDAIRALPDAAARPAAVRFLGVWGVVVAFIGAAAMLVAIGNDAPITVGSTDLEVTFGEYNLRGGLVLLVVGVAMIVAAVIRASVVAFVAAAVAVGAAVWIYIQFGRGEVWLGGTTETAVVFGCAAVVAVTTGMRINQPKGLS